MPDVARTLFAAANPERLGLGRAGAGVTMLLRPRLLPGLLGVDSATSARLSWALQMLGAREVALGLGSAVAFRSDERRGRRTWLAAGLLCDATDAVVLGAALGRGRVARTPTAAVVALAGAAVVMQAAELARR